MSLTETTNWIPRTQEIQELEKKLYPARPTRQRNPGGQGAIPPPPPGALTKPEATAPAEAKPEAAAPAEAKPEAAAPAEAK